MKHHGSHGTVRQHDTQPLHLGVARRTQTGSVSLEALLEFLLLVTIVPPVICCGLQVLLALVGLVLPWLALVAIAAIVIGALAAAVAAPRGRVAVDAGGNELPLPPAVRRPGGDRWRQH